MKTFGNRITLVKNGRGCYILDTVKGCSVCGTTKPNGCYGDCYAKRIASRYGIDFSRPVDRDFDSDFSQPMLFDFQDNEHINKIVKEIKNIDMPFVRIGDMGDPSENWEHTINVCKQISIAGKPIVIITKHWKIIPDNLLSELSKIDLCINTSISALDSGTEIQHRLTQFNRLKPYCHSVLRVVSCDFNMTNEEGAARSIIQNKLFSNGDTIDTVFRPSKNNPLITSGVINVKNVRFLRSKVLASVFSSNPYLGDCSHCPDLCGIAHP